MWYFTKHGFYSVVAARKGGKNGKDIDPKKVTVRARLESHLTALKDAYPTDLGKAKIITAAGTDYQVRMVLDKDVWLAVAYQLSAEIDYDNFKSAVEDHQGPTDYERALHRVWGVMHAIQKPTGNAYHF